MKRAGILALAAVLLGAGIVAIAACVVPQHRFGDPPAIDGSPGVDANLGPPATVTIASGVSLQGTRAFSDSVPLHRVFTSSYEITSSCVSEGQYASCVAAGACPEPPPDGGQIGLGQITIEHATAYCTWIGMRVPTEAELERAVRGDLGATTLPVPSPFGLDHCDLGESAVIVADNYECSAYVGRAWANPLQATGPTSHARVFRTTGTSGAAIPERAATSPVHAIRCARTLDTSAPPERPQEMCASVNCSIQDVAVGEAFGCAVRGDSSVWCWGSDEHGELGTTDVIDAMPAAFAFRPVAQGVAEVDAGSRFACTRMGTGVVQCWGDNTAGQVPGATGDTVQEPTSIAAGVTDIAVAGEHGCLINSDTSVSCWGRGGATPAGTGATTVTAIGITGATAIAAGARSECAIVGSTVQCWGVIHDAAGTLGYIAPASARTFSIAATQIAVGDGHACAVVATNVFCWGDRTHWGAGSGAATTPEVVTTATALSAPTVFASDAGTVIVEGSTVALNVGTSMGALTIDGTSIAFAPGVDGSGCATAGDGASCFGIERGQLGRSNACEPTPLTTPLVLP